MKTGVFYKLQVPMKALTLNKWLHSLFLDAIRSCDTASILLAMDAVVYWTENQLQLRSSGITDNLEIVEPFN